MPSPTSLARELWRFGQCKRTIIKDTIPQIHSSIFQIFCKQVAPSQVPFHNVIDLNLLYWQNQMNLEQNLSVDFYFVTIYLSSFFCSLHSVKILCRSSLALQRRPASHLLACQFSFHSLTAKEMSQIIFSAYDKRGPKNCFHPRSI